MSEKYFGIRPGPGRKHPDDEIKLCPKCGSEMTERFEDGSGFWWCFCCDSGYQEKVKK